MKKILKNFRRALYFCLSRVLPLEGEIFLPCSLKTKYTFIRYVPCIEGNFKLILQMRHIGHKLRVYEKRAASVQIDIRDNQLRHKQWQCRMINRTNSSAIIAKTAFDLFNRSYQWNYPIRSLTVRAINLCPANEPEQVDLFGDIRRIEKREQIETVVEDIRRRFGKYAIMPAALCQLNHKLPTDREIELTMPTGMVM